MKFKYFLVSYFFSVSLLQGQINELPSDQYMSIKINGVAFEEIENSKGNVSTLEKHFGRPLKIEDREGGAEENWRKIEFEGLTLTFYNVELEDFNPFVGYFNASSISVGDRTIKVGESIKGLGKDLIFNLNIDNTESIIIQAKGGDCCSIIIEFDQNTKLATKIEYFVWT